MWSHQIFIRSNQTYTGRDSLLICGGLKLFHQNVKSIHAKLNPITVFLRGKDIDFLKLSKTQTLKTLITLKFSAFRGTTLSIKVELLVLLEALAFILQTNTALYVEKN